MNMCFPCFLLQEKAAVKRVDEERSKIDSTYSAQYIWRWEILLEAAGSEVGS